MTTPVRIRLLLEIRTQFKVYKEKFLLSRRSIRCLPHRILSSHHQSIALLYLHMAVLRDHLECRHYLYVCLTPLLKCQILMIRAFFLFYILIYSQFLNIGFRPTGFRFWFHKYIFNTNNLILNLQLYLITASIWTFSRCVYFMSWIYLFKIVYV